jgi:predicted XRE-type DNA-binding protein
MPKTGKGTQSKAAGRAGRRVTNDDVVTTVRSGDNVFATLELPDADEWLAKAELARAIAGEIVRRGLTQIEAATMIGVSQSDVSNLARGRLAGYSMERLYRFLNLLGQDVRIVVQPKPRSRAHATLRTSIRRTG